MGSLEKVKLHVVGLSVLKHLFFRTKSVRFLNAAAAKQS